MNKLNLYSHEKWTDRIYTVTINMSMVHRITVMVIVGDEKIMVIDSAHGVDRELRRYVESFAGTGKPVILACTHCGIDHAGGAVLFDEWYLHRGDWPNIEKSLEFENRRGDFEPFALYNKEMIQYIRANMCEAPDPESVKEVKDGDVFNLGGIKVEAIHTPGHTAGHTAYYCREDKIAFVGDAINVDTHLKRLDKAGFEEYTRMLDRFMSIVDEDTKMFSGHLNRPHRMRVARNIREACAEIAAGKGLESDPPAEVIQKFVGPRGYNNPAMKMHYHGNCCVIYNSSLLN